jgi:hypothetical protein
MLPKWEQQVYEMVGRISPLDEKSGGRVMFEKRGSLLPDEAADDMFQHRLACHMDQGFRFGVGVGAEPGSFARYRQDDFHGVSSGLKG